MNENFESKDIYWESFVSIIEVEVSIDSALEYAPKAFGAYSKAESPALEYAPNAFTPLDAAGALSEKFKGRGCRS